MQPGRKKSEIPRKLYDRAVMPFNDMLKPEGTFEELLVCAQCFQDLMSVHECYDAETDGCGTEEHHNVWDVFYAGEDKS